MLDSAVIIAKVHLPIELLPQSMESPRNAGSFRPEASQGFPVYTTVHSALGQVMGTEKRIDSSRLHLLHVPRLGRHGTHLPVPASTKAILKWE